MPIRVAINGFGRVGRPTFRNLIEKFPEVEIVAINDLTAPETLAHLLKYDSVYGIYEKKVEVKEGAIIVEGKEFKVLAEPDPEKLPWEKLEIDIVLECTGRFREYEKAKKHILAGAKKVIISAPSKNPEKIPEFVLGVNEDKCDPSKWEICDMGSCTTNCLAPVVKVLHENFKIIRGFMTTVHSYTNDQRILDLPHRDLRRARAAALNIIPTTTGAAKAIGNVIPEMKGKLDGMAFRVPTPTVSVIDFVCQVEKETNQEEVNETFKKASQSERLKGILAVEEKPLVSSDYKQNPFSAIVDLLSTKVIGNLVKVVAWYDNEWAYAKRLAEFAEFVGKKMKS